MRKANLKRIPFTQHSQNDRRLSGGVGEGGGAALKGQLLHILSMVVMTQSSPWGETADSVVTAGK